MLSAKRSVLIIAVIGLSISLADVASAQRNRSGWLALLRMQSVQQELELIDDQQEEIVSLQEEMWESIQQEYRAMGDLSTEERRSRILEIRNTVQERQSEYETKIKDLLSPQQSQRLSELEYQSQFRRYGNGATGLLKNNKLLEEMGVDSEQKKALEEKVKEVNKVLEEKIKKLRKEAQDKILSVLDEKQRKIYQTKVGDPFDFGDNGQSFSGIPERQRLSLIHI